MCYLDSLLNKFVKKKLYYELILKINLSNYFNNFKCYILLIEIYFVRTLSIDFK